MRAGDRHLGGLHEGELVDCWVVPADHIGCQRTLQRDEAEVVASTDVEPVAEVLFEVGEVDVLTGCVDHQPEVGTEVISIPSEKNIKEIHSRMRPDASERGGESQPSSAPAEDLDFRKAQAEPGVVRS